MRNRKILQPIRNWKLRKKLILSFVALVMLPVLTLSGYSMWQMQLAMSEKVQLTFSDSIYQISSRISRQFERYNAALNFLSLNRQLSNVFENEESSYYDQYEAMNYVLEPTLMMVQQLAPELESIGIYTSNHHLKERNEAVLYLERLEGKPWFERFSMRQRLCWTMDDGAVTGLARLMKLSVKTPVQLRMPSVERVAHNGVTYIFHVYPYLVCPACFQAQIHQGIFSESFYDAVVGHRPL